MAELHSRRKHPLTQQQRDKYNARDKAWREANPALIQERRRVHRSSDFKRYFIKRAKDNARTKSVPFNLSKEDIFTPITCPILGIRLNYENRGCWADDSPSIDRIVPELGYVKGNIQIISMRANRIKLDATPEELRKVADYMTRITCMSSNL